MNILLAEQCSVSTLADYPAMSFFFVCWHSRKWWPPICGGTLQLALLRLEKVNWTDYFCIKSISYTNCQWKGKKTAQKTGKNSKKKLSFSSLSQNSWNFQIEGSLKIEISKMRDPSKWKFPKRGKVYTCPVFCKKYQATINIFQY